MTRTASGQIFDMVQGKSKITAHDLYESYKKLENSETQKEFLDTLNNNIRGLEKGTTTEAYKLH